MYVCIYLLSLSNKNLHLIITLHLRFNALNIKQLKKQLSDKNPSIEIFLDHRLQG